MKRILITGAAWMLAHDFMKYYVWDDEIISFSSAELDITNYKMLEETISNYIPDLIINFAAYTKVDDAEDIGTKMNFDVNTLWVSYLAQLTKKYKSDFITFSTDYVFDGLSKAGYTENDTCNPINNYGMAKYLWEKISIKENEHTIIIRTSWLYGGWKQYKNFVNTMLHLSSNKQELTVVSDQYGIPTSCKDLCLALYEIISHLDIYRAKIFHFSNSAESPISWFDFTEKIIRLSNSSCIVMPCNSSFYKMKAKRPQNSMIINNSNIQLQNWIPALEEYITQNS